jgi:uncharacterized membrane-anchored protein
MRTAQNRIALVLIGMLLGLPQTAGADEPAQPPVESLTPAQQQARAAWQAAAAAMVTGPTQVTLRDQAKLDLPAGFAFIPKKESAALMHAMGNQTGDELIGLIFPQAQDKSWMVGIDYEDSGYIKDDDAKDWDADELLKSLRDGTEAANEERTKIGVPPIQVTHWIEKPAYEASVHHLVWSAEVKLRDGDDPDPTINYNTYVLGREGYISMNLITPASTIDVDKPVAKKLLASVTFNEGKRYGDFKSSTDKVAAYGLAALVAGVAAKKLGLLALAGVFILKFAKLFAIGAAAVGGGVWKWLKGRNARDGNGTPA